MVLRTVAMTSIANNRPAALSRELLIFGIIPVRSAGKATRHTLKQGRPMLKISLLRVLRHRLTLAGFALIATGVVQASTSAAAGQVSTLADGFYAARGEYDPLNYATANGDSRYDDKIGLSIASKVRAA